MKHAYLIMAHNEPEILQRLILILDHPENDIYVHIDKKSDLKSFKLSPNLCVHSHLFILRHRIDVRWSGYSQIACEMKLLETAYNHGGYDYYHIMSGTTLPIKSMQFINTFFEQHKGTIFLGIDVGDIEQTIEERIKYRYFFIDNKICSFNEMLKLHLNGLSIRLQKFFHITRTSSLPLKIGANWCSITQECVYELLINKRWVDKTFRYGYCVDELYKQTVIWNSPLRENLYSVGNSLEGCMYEIDWNRGNGCSPYTYSTESDIELLIKSDKLFARKFSSQHMNVVKRLIESIHREKMIATEA